MEKRGYTYILASKENGTLYIGVTSDLVKRVHEHRSGVIDGFTKRYKVHALVYYEQYDCIADAISREKAMKKWRRKWKLDLINRRNPEWRDLYPEILGVEE